MPGAGALNQAKDSIPADMLNKERERDMDRDPPHYVFEDVAEELSGPLRRYLERLVGNRATDNQGQDRLAVKPI